MVKQKAIITTALFAAWFAAAANGQSPRRDDPPPARNPSPGLAAPPVNPIGPPPGAHRPFVNSTVIPVPWSPPVSSPIWSGDLRVNPRRSEVGQGDGRFGIREGRNHPALDLPAPVGTPVHPVAPGEVVRVGPGSGGAGYRVIVRHDDGFSSNYMHLQPNSPVRVGDRVTPEHTIGFVGRTGNVPGGADSHVHLQMTDASGRKVVPNLMPHQPTPTAVPDRFSVDTSPATVRGLPPSPLPTRQAPAPSPSSAFNPALSTSTARAFFPPLPPSPPATPHPPAYGPLNGVRMPLSLLRGEVQGAQGKSSNRVKEQILGGK